VEAVLPAVPVRQWVRTVPHRLRYRLAFDHALCRAVLASSPLPRRAPPRSRLPARPLTRPSSRRQETRLAARLDTIAALSYE